MYYYVTNIQILEHQLIVFLIASVLLLTIVNDRVGIECNSSFCMLFLNFYHNAKKSSAVLT